MLYKYRFHISFFLFLTIIFLVGGIFGAGACGDGWASRSIGSRGACSHHGGVSSVPAVVSFIAACIAVISFNSYIDGKYKKHRGFVVRIDLPFHPLESALQIKPEFIFYEVPTLNAVSRKNFECFLCNSIFVSGSVYQYVEQKNRNVKYCSSCSQLIPGKNAKAAQDKEMYFINKKFNEDEINNYYRKNAVFR